MAKKKTASKAKATKAVKAKPVAKPKAAEKEGLGSLGNASIIEVRDVTLGNKEYKKVVLSDGTTQVLSEKDLKAQTK